MRISLKRMIALVAVIGAMLVPVLAPALAMAEALTPEDVAKMEARLNLTPEQRAAVQPILRESMTARSATFEKYGVDLKTCSRPGALGLIRLNKDMNRINTDMRTRLAAILTPAQLREYDRIVAEQTVIVKEKIMC